jgi:cytochrome c-type biogenesis protein CcmH/NrfF
MPKRSSDSAFGYLAALVGIFLIYLPYLILFVLLLIAAGILYLLLLHFALLVRKLRRSRRRPTEDNSWILTPRDRQPSDPIRLPQRRTAAPQ